MDTDIFFSAADADRTDWPLDGSDTLIAKFNGPFGNAALIRWAYTVSERAATNLGTHLHHADFVLTSNPDTVREWGIMPEHRDCLECIAGVSTALHALEAEPDLILAVGQLYWSPRLP